MDQFRRNYPDLLVCEKPRNITMRNQKTQALSWKRLYKPKTRLVQDSFSLLGYETIVEACEKAGGYNSTRKPTAQEAALIDILEKTAKDIFDGFIEQYPAYKIISNESAVCTGTACVTVLQKKRRNKFGNTVRRELHYMELKQSLFAPDMYSEAFSVYSHELCHCFGGDSSRAFSGALTSAMGLAVEKHEYVLEGKRQWEAYHNLP
jgi:hypothetical protein